jgi:hydrogenase maturation protease
VTAPVLVFGWGNPSRGDDALGPFLIERLSGMAESRPDWGEVEFLTDFQLQVEDALELQGRSRVLFVDASAATELEGQTGPGFAVSLLAPGKDSSFTSHALSPQAVMQVYVDLNGAPPPPCHLLAIAGEDFELGQPLSTAAAVHLDAAVAWTAAWLAEG